MKRLIAVLSIVAALTVVATAQPPDGGKDKKGDKKGKDKGGKGKPGEGRGITSVPRPENAGQTVRPTGLIANPDLLPAADNRSPNGFTLSGAAEYADFASLLREQSGRGVRFNSIERGSQGTISTTVDTLTPASGRWFRFSVRGLAQEGFSVEHDALYLKVEYFKDRGRNPLDHVVKSIYPQVEADRRTLVDPGTNRKLGPATWRQFELEFHTPFPEVDALCLSVGFADGAGTETKCEFLVNQFDLVAIPVPADYRPPTVPKGAPAALDRVVKLGGRWYFDPRDGDRTPPARFDHTNADRLLYLSDRLEAPFAGNTSAWLRKGWYDREGRLVVKDEFVPDNVVLTVTDKHLVIRSKDLPNHPTADFPDTGRSLDGNPNVIREKDYTWRLPLEPRVNPAHIAMDKTNSNRALPMGPTGVAINGVALFNPFDAGSEEAIHRLDRCCGHPGPDSTYHYHKYPVCVKSPWADDGAGHSPLIGFAFDGFPIYGPYESRGVMAKDATDRPLNEFNLHEDPERGPHYHVTPGRFPHLFGGYWGVSENSARRPR